MRKIVIGFALVGVTAIATTLAFTAAVYEAYRTTDAPSLKNRGYFDE
jgi:multisubunit Na+/H+ antiporter MnhC subunit